MTYNENNLTERNNFILPTTIDNGFSAEDLGDDFEGLQLSFQKVKIPAGGSLQFELPGDSPDNPDYAKYIDGVIIHNHASNAYWPAGEEFNESVAPFCCSYDGKTGHGIPGGACEVCEMNQYGTDQNGGKGKACKNMRSLYILRSGEAMPIQLTLPPTSIRPFNDFVNAVFVTRRRPTWAAIVRIGLKKADNGSNVYSVATFQKIGDFSGDELMQMKQYVETFRIQIKEMRKQRALEADCRNESNGIYDSNPRYSSTDNGEHFEVISSDIIIDGSKNGLPA